MLVDYDQQISTILENINFQKVQEYEGFMRKKENPEFSPPTIDELKSNAGYALRYVLRQDCLEYESRGWLARRHPTEHTLSLHYVVDGWDMLDLKP